MEVAVVVEKDRKFRLHREIVVAHSETENFTVNITEPPGELFCEFEDTTYVLSISEIIRAILDLRKGGEKKILLPHFLEEKKEGIIL